MITQPDEVVPGCGVIGDATCQETLGNSLLIPSSVCEDVRIFTQPICCEAEPMENPLVLCPESAAPSSAPSPMDGDDMEAMTSDEMASEAPTTSPDSSSPRQLSLGLSAVALALVASLN